MNLLKTFTEKTLLALMIALFMAACGDDDSQEPNANPLIGHWKWTINERLNCPNPNDEGELEVYDCSEFCYDVEFKNDGTATVTIQEEGTTETGTGNYTLAGSDFTLCITDEGIEHCTSGQLTLSEGKFTLFIKSEDGEGCDVNRIFEKQ